MLFRSMAKINETGVLVVELDGVKETIEKEDLLIEAKETDGYVSNSYRDMTVVLDTNLTPELVEEGFVREIISKIQNMRKDAGFEVMDHIHVSQSGSEKIQSILVKNQELIMSEVLADCISIDDVKGVSKEWNINGETCTIGVEKL